MYYKQRHLLHDDAVKSMSRTLRYHGAFFPTHGTTTAKDEKIITERVHYRKRLEKWQLWVLWAMSSSALDALYTDVINRTSLKRHPEEITHRHSYPSDIGGMSDTPRGQ